MLATLPDPSPVALHPSLPQLYRRKVEQLESLLGDPELASEAMEAIRALIARIVLTPRPAGGLDAVLYGDLAQILTIAEAAQTQEARRVVGGRSGDVLGRLSVVAGARNTLHLLTEARVPPALCAQHSATVATIGA